MADVPEVLFVCVRNAGRSQIAAALLNRYGSGRVRARSAGIDPAPSLNPVVVRVMAERGMDLSTEVPRRLTDDAVRAADLVVTMGCADACRVYPGTRCLEWGVEEPAGKAIEEVRSICDDIDHRVQSLLAELLTRPTDNSHSARRE